MQMIGRLAARQSDAQGSMAVGLGYVYVERTDV